MAYRQLMDTSIINFVAKVNDHKYSSDMDSWDNVEMSNVGL